MPRDNRENEIEKHRSERRGFRQTHGGRSQFKGGEWGASSELGQNSGYRESDSYERKRGRPFSERPYISSGRDFDQDERDDEFSSREYNRSRFASMSKEDHTGKGPRGYKRSDDRINEEVCEILFRNPMVDASDIDVDVTDGLVTLSGSVETRYEKREAERSIENVSGVMDIQNELHLSGAEYKEGGGNGTQISQ
jgi:HSP20 family molecular chaperone IbpA